MLWVTERNGLTCSAVLDAYYNKGEKLREGHRIIISTVRKKTHVKVHVQASWHNGPFGVTQQCVIFHVSREDGEPELDDDSIKVQAQIKTEELAKASSDGR